MFICAIYLSCFKKPKPGLSMMLNMQFEFFLPHLLDKDVMTLSSTV